MKASRRTLTSRLEFRPEPTYCTLGDTLCRVRFWTEPEWAAIDADRRPPGAVHRPGSGWIAPVPANGFS